MSQRSRSTIRSIAAALVCCAAWVAVAAKPAGADEDGFTWGAVKLAIKTAYPNVHSVTTAQLAAWLESDSLPRPILLDTRAKSEFEVSHLRGAVLATDTEDALAALADVAKDQVIVTYCSVGYRSGGIASALSKNGFTNVYNLEGSIFLWANQDRPVYRGDKAANKVHPYDGKWGRLLDRRFWPESFN